HRHETVDRVGRPPGGRREPLDRVIGPVHVGHGIDEIKLATARHQTAILWGSSTGLLDRGRPRPFESEGLKGRNKNRATRAESRDQLKTRIANGHECVNRKNSTRVDETKILFSEIRESAS